jgi:endonuclease VIII
MAEGDSILRIARRLDQALAGEAISARTPGPRRPTGLAPTQLDGRILERVESRGKNLLLHFEDRLVLHSHLGMRGTWQLYREGERWRRPRSQAWIALAGNGAEAVNFGGSRMRIATEAQLRQDPRLARLGPDVLAEEFDSAAVIGRMRAIAPEIELGQALLGQRLVAGIGNIFKSEGCFAARIDPNRRVDSLGDDELGEVLIATRGLMLEAVESGRQPNRIYRRAGQPCPRCGTRIQSRAQGDDARTTYWCPSCQTP